MKHYNVLVSPVQTLNLLPIIISMAQLEINYEHVFPYYIRLFNHYIFAGLSYIWLSLEINYWMCIYNICIGYLKFTQINLISLLNIFIKYINCYRHFSIDQTIFLERNLDHTSINSKWSLQYPMAEPKCFTLV